MVAERRGAKHPDDIIICIIPHDEKNYANAYCDVVISTGLNYPVGFIAVYSTDALIMLGMALE